MPSHLISDVEYLKFVLRKRFNIDISSYKNDFIRRRLYSRMVATNSRDISSYIRLLYERPEEVNKLLDSMMINVSTFFRDPQIWPRLQEIVFKPLLEKKSKIRGILRILSAGCSCGEEPYSIAIAIEELFKRKGLRVQYSITGIDVDEEALAYARSAIYDEKALVNVPKSALAEYFEPIGHGKFKVKDNIKGHVKFIKLDLRSCRYPQGFDVIFCRNVLIYFSEDVKNLVIKALAGSMTSGGYLVLGLTESIGDNLRHLFKLVDSSAKIYQKQLSS